MFKTAGGEDKATEIFDKYFKDDFHVFQDRLADCLETITIIGQEDDREKIPLGYQEHFSLFSEAINMLLICYRNIRMGHWLAGLVLLRQVIEIISVCLVIWQDTKTNLKHFHKGQLKATKCVKASKKIMPLLIRIWGDLSNYHVHPSKNLIGTSFVEQDTDKGWSKVFIGGYLHPDQSEKIEIAVINVLFVAFYLHAATELIFWQLIEHPEFWRSIGKTGGLDFGTWNPSKENEEYLKDLAERLKKIDDPFYGYEHRIRKEDMKKYSELMKSGKIQDAYDIKGLRKAIKGDPKFYLAIYLLANAYRASDQNKKAIAFYKHFIKKSDEKYDSYHFLGSIYAEIGEHNKAINAYKMHVEIYPDAHITLNRIGLSYDQIGDYDNAVNACRQAQKIEKNYYNAVYNEANALKHRKEYDAAISKYKEAISIKGDPWAYHNMGLTYLAQENNYQSKSMIS